MLIAVWEVVDLNAWKAQTLKNIKDLICNQPLLNYWQCPDLWSNANVLEASMWLNVQVYTQFTRVKS